VKISVENVSETRKSVGVSVPAAEVADAEKKVLAELVKVARLPGFRPGHAPENMVKARYAKEFKGELQNRLVNDAYKFLADESKLDIYGVTQLDGADKIESGKDLELKFTVDLRPSFDLPEYKGLPVNVEKTDVSDDEVKQACERIISQRAEFKPVDAPAKKGDYVQLSYAGTLDGKPLEELVADKPLYTKQASTWEEAGADEGVPCVRAVVDALVGMKKGDKKTVSQEYAKDFEVAQLAGKTVSYDIEVKEVRERVLPTLDEAFYKTMGADNAEQFAENVKKDIERGKAQRIEQNKREQLVKLLQEKANFALPESAVEAETQEILRSRALMM
jgi:trigger factor